MTNYKESMTQTLEYMSMIRERKILERELSDTELKRREEIVQDLPESDFRDRYGDRWMEARIHTATKMAKQESVEQEKDDLTEAGGFTPSMIKKLRGAYDSINKIDPTSPAGKKMTQMLDKMTTEQLQALVKADIKFISLLAVNRLIRKGFNAAQIKKLKEQQEEFTEMLNRWEIDESTQIGTSTAPVRPTAAMNAAVEILKRGKDSKTFKEGKVTKKERDRLEDENQHGELALKLTKAYGTPAEVKKIEAINKRHDKSGSIERKDQQERDKISNKYYKMAEEVELDEVDRSSYKDRITKYTGMLKDAEKEKPLDKKWISMLKDRIKSTNADQRSVLGMSKEEVDLDEVYQVYVKSPTAKSGWIPQGQPHKTEADAKKDAKNAGGVTKIVKEEADLDEASPNKQKSDVIVMKKDNSEKSVVGASGVKKAEKDGYKIQYALLAPSGKKVTDPKGIMKAIKGGDKLGIGEEVDLDEAPNIKNGKIHISKKDYAKKPKEYKGKRNGKPTLMALDPKTGSTTSFEVVLEEVELDEAKYELYHKDFSTAMQHAYKMAKKLHGITVDPKEIDDKVATGPKKPSEGKTNKYRLKGDKGGIQIQVYNKGGSKPFELNMYKEEMESNEMEIEEGATTQILAHGGKGQYKVVSSGGAITVKFKGKVVGTGDFDRGADSFFISVRGKKGQQSFDSGQEIADYFAKNKIKESWEIGTDAYRKYLEDVTPMEGARGDAYRDMKKSGELDDKEDEDVRATKDDRKAANKNILHQLKKTIDTKGKADIEFLDKKKTKVPYKIAMQAIKKYMSQRKSTDKLKFQQTIAKSYKDMLLALKEDYSVPQSKEETILNRIDTKIQERKNG